MIYVINADSKSASGRSHNDKNISSAIIDHLTAATNTRNVSAFIRRVQLESTWMDAYKNKRLTDHRIVCIKI